MLFPAIAVRINGTRKMEITRLLKNVASIIPGLFVVDVDLPLDVLCKDDLKLEQVMTMREFHISLGRTVPISVHQIDSAVSMLRQKLQSSKGFVFCLSFAQSAIF